MGDRYGRKHTMRAHRIVIRTYGKYTKSGEARTSTYTTKRRNENKQVHKEAEKGQQPWSHSDKSSNTPNLQLCEHCMFPVERRSFLMCSSAFFIARQASPPLQSERTPPLTENSGVAKHCRPQPAEVARTVADQQKKKLTVTK